MLAQKAETEKNMDPTAEFEAAKKALTTEEEKLDAGEPNSFQEAMSRFCEAQRAMEAANG
jgi:hypothetical protein